MTLMTSAIASQRALANGYVMSGRATDLGLYLLGQQRATLTHFARIVPPETLQAVHSAFLQWQRAGIEVLAADLRRRDPHATLPYADASREFAATLQALSKTAPSNEREGVAQAPIDVSAES